MCRRSTVGTETHVSRDGCVAVRADLRDRLCHQIFPFKTLDECEPLPSGSTLLLHPLQRGEKLRTSLGTCLPLRRRTCQEDRCPPGPPADCADARLTYAN